MLGLDLSLWSSLLTLALLMAGVVATVWAGWVEKNRGKVVVGFFLLGALGFIVEHFQRAEDAAAAAAQAKADTESVRAIQALKDSSSEQTKVARDANEARVRSDKLATEARTRSDELANENRKLAGETLQRVIGDPENPPYIQVDNVKVADGIFHARLYIVNPSKVYPVKDVVADLVEGGTRITSISQSIPPAARVALSVPNIFGQDSAYVRIDSLSAIASETRMSIAISCNAGRYTQYLGLIRTGEAAIMQASHVVKRGEAKAILSESDKGFPKDFNKWPAGLKF